MIINGLELGPEPVPCNGPLIVGSGPVALTLALYLNRQGQNVTVLERGATFAALDQDRDLSVEFAHENLRGATIARTSQIGGGLNLWGGQLACPVPLEFEEKGDGMPWPIALEELTRHFQVLGEIMGQRFELPLRNQISTSTSSKLNNVGLSWIATAWLRRPKFPRNVWRELSVSESVRIFHGVFVDQLEVDRQTGLVSGAAALRKDGSRIKFIADTVVIAGGTIETCRLLLLPSSIKERQPWHALHWLGRGFNEHLDADTAVIEPINRSQLVDIFDPVVRAGTKYLPKLFARISVDPETSLSAVAMPSFQGNVRNNVAELVMLARSLTPRELPGSYDKLILAAVGSTREALPLAWRYLRHKRIGSIIRNSCILRVSVEQPVRAENRITLSASMCDRFGIPLPQLEWRKGEEEGRVFAEMTKRFKCWAEENSIAKVNIDPELEADAYGFASRTDEGFHHAGGTRMASAATHGVVGPDLQVFGTRGLYCCGASILPRSGYSNPTLTAMALAVRLGEKLSVERGRK